VSSESAYPPASDDAEPPDAEEAESQIASVLAWALPPGKPAPALRARLIERARTTAVSTLRRDDGIWFRVADGVSRKVVFSDAQDRGSTALWRMEAGAAVQLQAERGDVVVIVIDGSVEVADDAAPRALTVGDALGLHAHGVHLRAGAPAALLVAVTFDAIDGPPGVEYALAEDHPPVPLNGEASARPLFLHRAPRPDVALITVAAHGALDEHEHPETEELLCLDGSCESHGEHLDPGDYQRTRAGSAHDRTTTTTGSTILVLRRHFS
jgi:quercetin dioxygenase-like cupin family protein